VLFDWFTTLAQIVNFLILLWLLKRFLYKPILNAMNEREEKILRRLKEAEQAQEQADQEAQEFSQKTAELENRRENMLSEARIEAERLRKEMLHDARQEVQESQERWYRSIQQSKEAFLRDLYQRASSQTYEVARKALADLANEDLERHVIETFLRRLRDLQGEERQALERALGDANGTITVRSAFDVPDELREAINEQIELLATNGYEINFERLPDLISGIELKLGGKKISWSLSSYLGELEENLAHALRERVHELNQLGEKG
jgi:F-type H+-transporting ATPase subunit b